MTRITKPLATVPIPTDWRKRALHAEAELQAVCIDRDAQVDEVVRLRGALQKIADMGQVNPSWHIQAALDALAR